MSKLMVVLALYAAGVSTYLLLDRSEAAPAPATGAPAESAGSVELREAVTEARKQAKSAVLEELKDLDVRLARIEKLRKETVAGLQKIDEQAESAARLNAGTLEAMEERIKGLEDVAGKLSKLGQEVAALRRRVKEVEDRPAVIERVIEKGGTPTQKPVEDDTPKLPPTKMEDPDVVKAKIAKALKDIQSDDYRVAWPAIETVRKYKVLEATDRLVFILGNFKEPFARMASATALGALASADTVEPLIEALVDKNDKVAQTANKSIYLITGYDTKISATARIQERRRARNTAIQWWRENEQAVRDRLGQPKGEPPAGGK